MFDMNMLINKFNSYKNSEENCRKLFEALFALYVSIVQNGILSNALKQDPLPYYKTSPIAYLKVSILK